MSAPSPSPLGGETERDDGSGADDVRDGHCDPACRPSAVRRMMVFLGVAGMALILDQGSKALAQARLSSITAVVVIPRVLSLRLLYNPGASLGFGSEVTPVITILAAAACVAFVVAAMHTTSMRWTVVLSLAFAGAAGNLVDRIVRAEGFLDGRVVDFLDYGWSVGNVADILLTVAGVGFVALLLMDEPFAPAAARRAQSRGHAGQ